MIGNIVYIREAQNREEFFVMKEKCCCVSGHRDIPADKLPYVKEELRKAVQAAIEDGFTRFISGFAEGTDLLFAAIVVEEKEKNPAIHLEAAIPICHPCKKQKLFVSEDAGQLRFYQCPEC